MSDGEVYAYPLSSGQRRLWFLEQWSPDTPAYNIAVNYRVAGPLDLDALQGAFDDLVARHEPLRTTFTVDEHGDPLQLVHPPAPCDFEVLPVGDEEDARRALAAEAHRPFSLERGPLLRVRVLRLGPQDHRLTLVIHHVVFDGWSLPVLLRDLQACYAHRRDGLPPRLPELPIQYADYAIWERERVERGDLERDLAYWRGKLAGAVDLAFPLDKPRPTTQRFRGARHLFRLPPAVADALRALCERERVTPFMAALAAYQAVLHRWSGRDGFVVGTPGAGRDRPETHDLVGFFVNSLPLRADLSGDPTYRELLARVRETCLGAFEHQALPFDRLVDALRIPRDPSRNPLFQTLFTFEDAARAPPPAGPLPLVDDHPQLETAKLDVALSLETDAEGIVGAVDYDVDLYEHETMVRVGDAFCALFAAALRDPDARVSRLPLRAQDAARPDAHAAAPEAADATFVDLFEAQARRAPDATAVVDGATTLTYAQLDARAARVARHLRARGLAPETPVAVLLDRSADLVASLLGVMRAGCAYVPLDPAYPPARLHAAMEDVKAPVLVTRREHLARLGPHPDALLVDALPDDDISDDIPLAAPSAARPEGLAYVLFTSGSTGRPKGVMVEHRSLALFLRGQVDAMEVTPRDRVLCVASPGFDASLFQMGLPLAAGATLVLAPADARAGPAAARLLREARVTVADLTPSAWKTVPPTDLPDLRLVIAGGEACPQALVDAWGRGRRFINAYGPTEATVSATHADCAPGAPGQPPIGRPLPGVRVHILDAAMAEVPEGAVGEIHLGGACLARGYFGRPDLTAERFVIGRDGARLYRTGDLARRRPDGQVEFLGRADEQVKVRGFRIEPAEVEAALLAHPALAAAVVVARPDAAGEPRLVAYVVPREAPAPSPAALRAFLQARLPPHMVPSLLVPLDALPLTAHGKVDRAALPPPEALAPAPAHEAPRTKTEEALCAAWSEVLGVPRVGVHDNFFDLGGDSLLAIKATLRAQEKGVRVTPKDLFERQTVAALAPLCDAPRHDAPRSLVALQPRGDRPALFFVHGGGMVGSYAALARELGDDQPFYAFQPVGADGAEAPQARVEEMAELYVREMRRVQPRGPYHVGGWSLGGAVAHEMARRLEAEGEKVALLALADAGLGEHGADLDEARALAQTCGRLASGRGGDDEVRRVLETLRMPLTPEEMGRENARHFLRLVEAQLHAGLQHRPGPYGGDALLLLSEDSLRRDPGVRERWARQVRGRVQQEVVPGDHWSMVREPAHLRVLAAALRKALDAAGRGA